MGVENNKSFLNLKSWFKSSDENKGQNLSKKRLKRKRSTGSVLIEAALTLPLFFLTIFFLINILRYFYTTCVLNLASFQAGRWLSQVEMTEVPDVESCGVGTTLNSLDAKCVLYHNNLTYITQKTENFLRTALGESGYAGLQQYTMYDHALYSTYGYTISPGFSSITSPVIILRAGECAKSSLGAVLHHPNRGCGQKVTNYAQCMGRTTGLPGEMCMETMTDLLKEYPVAFSIQSKQAAIVPMMSRQEFDISGSQAFYWAAPPNVVNVVPTLIVTLSTIPPIVVPPTSTATSTATSTPAYTSTATSTPTSTATNTPTSTPTFTSTPTNTPTNTPTTTNTPTRTATVTNTATNTATRTATVTNTATNTPTITNTATNTPTVTNTATNTPTITNTATRTATMTATVTNTATNTPTITNTATNTPTITNTATNTPTITNTATRTATMTATVTNTATNTPTITNTATNTPTITNTATNTPTITNTATRTATMTATVTNTATNTPTITNTATNTPTITNTATRTATMTATVTNTATNTPTITNTATNTPTITNTATNTPTITNTATRTATMTATVTNTATRTPTITNTATNTPTITNTATRTPTVTNTATTTPSVTATSTPLPCTANVTGTGWTYTNSDGPMILYIAAPYSVSWSSTNAVSCSLNAGAVATSGSSSGYTATAAGATYTLSCLNSAGVACTDSLNVSAPPPPTGGSGSCAVDSASGTFSWTRASGYGTNYVRVCEGLSTVCSGAYIIYDDNYTGAPTVTFATTPGKTYTWWVHTKDTTSGAWSDIVWGNITCACNTITLSPASLPNGTVGSSYSQTVTASPASSYTYSITAGSLPTGLGLNASTGGITGTPTAAGTYSFTVGAMNNTTGCYGEKNYSITTVISCTVTCNWSYDIEGCPCSCADNSGCCDDPPAWWCGYSCSCGTGTNSSVTSCSDYSCISTAQTNCTNGTAPTVTNSTSFARSYTLSNAANCQLPPTPTPTITPTPDPVSCSMRCYNGPAAGGGYTSSISVSNLCSGSISGFVSSCEGTSPRNAAFTAGCAFCSGAWTSNSCYRSTYCN